MSKTLATAALFLAVAAPAHAAGHDHDRDQLKIAQHAYLVALAADELSTAGMLHAGWTEADPVARALVHNGEPPRLLLGAAADIGLTLLINHTLAHSHPKLATAGFWVAGSLRLGFALHNTTGILNHGR